MRILSVVGARPNFMKIAPVCRAVEAWNSGDGGGQVRNFGRGTSEPPCRIEHVLVHTGQHYDQRMSEAFFEALGIPRPDVDLGIGSGTHAEQVGRTMIAFEKVVREQQPDWIVVVGDVNATCACSITAKKEHVKLAHIEAGLRSFDLDMPEEINRMVTDRLADLLFVTDEIAKRNLKAEGVSDDRIKLVGNVMIDTLLANKAAAEELDVGEIVASNRLAGDGEEGTVGPWDCGTVGQPDEGGGKSMVHSPLSIVPTPGGSAGETDVTQSHSHAITHSHPDATPPGFAALTMHRPSNVDSKEVLGPIIDFLVEEVAREMPIVWPIHPRARKQLEKFSLWEKVRGCPGMILLEPVGYHEMLKLNMSCRIMFTDSGGLQEECCVLGTPCLVLRWNTERPVTLDEHGGVGLLVGNDVDRIRTGYRRLKEQPRHPQAPPHWDGRTAERIVKILAHPAS